MPANVETMFYAGEVPWHGEGVYVGDKDVDSAQAIEAAGLDWTVKVEPVFLGNGNVISGEGAVVRQTDGSVLGMTSAKYTPVQNREGFQFMDSLVESGEMKYHTAGSLQGGKKVWILGKMPGQFEVVPGDIHDKFVLLALGHDGKTSIQGMPTTVRVVCANTLGAAMHENRKNGGANSFKLKHTSQVHDRLAEARGILAQSEAQIAKYEEFCKTLAGKSMTSYQAEQFFIDLMGGLRENKKGEMVIKGQSQTLIDLFHGGRGNDMPGVRGTQWAAFNAVTEFANYKVGTKGQRSSNFGGVMFGSASNIIGKAAQALAKV